MFGLSANNDQQTDSSAGHYSDAAAQEIPPAMDQPVLTNGYDNAGTASTPASDNGFVASAPAISPTASPNPNPQVGMPPEPFPPPSVTTGNGVVAPPDLNQPVDESAKTMASPIMDGHSDEELLKMKQQALQSLAPLIDHLEQTPEEKFKTTMMLIQASDNAQLVKEAYEAANQITDEKTRAAALLDVVNEINYFTHQAAKSPQQNPN